MTSRDRDRRVSPTITRREYRGDDAAARLSRAAIIGCVLQVVPRPAEQKGFQVLPKRWIVERTFAWLNSYRRLSKDYEYRTDTSETMVYLAMIRLMLKRLR